VAVVPVRKAVFPVAGLGTRFLPATKSIPKEMLPIVDKPLIQYAVDEAIAAGIDTLIFVTSRKKHSISDHFDTAFELETKLLDAGKTELVQKLHEILPPHISRAHVPQLDTLGLGHAVLCARSVVGDEPFAVLLADDMIKTTGPGCLEQMLSIHQQTGANVVAVQEVAAEETGSYGIVELDDRAGRDSRIRSVVEKPAPAQAPSNLGVVGRYVLNPSIFAELEKVGADAGGEIQLTDAIARQIDSEDVIAHAFEGVRYDCGSKIGFVKATVDYALDHADMRRELIEFVQGSVDKSRG
jgi:UTP--glucose-1-phosphate uridylyltransferase